MQSDGATSDILPRPPGGHYILCGLGRIGARVLDYLQATGTPIVVIDSRDLGERGSGANVTLIRGDCRQRAVLEQAGITRAAGLLIVTSDDLINLSTTLMAHELNPALRVVVRMFNQELIHRLGPALSNVSVLSTSALVAPILALLAQNGEALGAFTDHEGKRLQVAEVPIRVGSPWAGQQLGAVAANHQVIPVGHRSGSAPARLLSDVAAAAVLATGDRLIVCG